jgi:hypothetical protein
MSPLIVDSVTHLTERGLDRVVICGSHCGIYAAYLAARAGVRAVILNDAGIGRDRAGIAGLSYLADLGMPAATVSSKTARIGDGADCALRGVISFANWLASDLGCMPGQTAAAAARCLAEASTRLRPPRPVSEARCRIDGKWGTMIDVWALDSASLVRSDDAGSIILAGSHGGLLGGDPATALKVDAFAAVYNDATGGMDGAGFSRLPVLDRRHIAAATVDAMRARIGSGRSTYEDGILTRVNDTAKRGGARIGMTARAFVELMASTLPRSRK